MILAVVNVAGVRSDATVSPLTNPVYVPVSAGVATPYEIPALFAVTVSGARVIERLALIYVIV